ncbi:MAG: hypothetical protein KDB04_10990 [Acidimicrobiales bacterium]|nr:hypothetical protein [Acidimicrobiales bacterium]
MKRTLGSLAALAALALGLAVGAPDGAGAASGSITPWQSSAAIGASFSATANGCPTTETETDTGFTYQEAQLVLITQTPAGERLAALGLQIDQTARRRFTVPAWVDPDDPAVLAGSCVRTTYEVGTGGDAQEVLFDFPDVAFDIVAGSAAFSGPTLTLDRTTAQGGQVLRATISGCEGFDVAEAFVDGGPDLSGRDLGPFLTYGLDEVGPGGTATFELPLTDVPRGGATPEGDHVVVGLCGRAGATESSFSYASTAPVPITVSGTNPVEAMEAEVIQGGILVSGSGCTGGRTVEVRADVYRFEGEPLPVQGLQTRGDDAGAALAQRDLPALATLADDAATADEPDPLMATVAPDAAGDWSVIIPISGEFEGEVTADCGDPFADGFRYESAYVSSYSGGADVYVDRVSPTSSPTGGEVVAHLLGICDGDAAVDIVDPDTGDVLDSSDPAGGLEEGAYPSVAVTAPTEPGSYELGATCDGELGGTVRYDVFAPAAIAKGTGPAEPLTGWPETGERERFDGRLGPIELGGDEPISSATKRALSPSELYTSVPRPDGDFAITEITFDLVYGDGTPVDPADAQIGYFVIMDRSHPNPACPGGTFGLPGRLVAASGNEKTVLQSPGPYGIVVHEADLWTGTYSIASRAGVDEPVYVSYSFETRRDLENVRPITTYFGSATGCSWFDYTLGGNGGTDVQSHYLTIAHDGRLIGAGASLAVGAERADWTNDRGERICSAEVTYGDEPVVPDDGWVPPRTYPDDRAIESISTCPLGELVTKGERLRFDAVYDDGRPRSAVTGVYVAYVWEGGGPAAAQPGGATPEPGTPNYTG